MRYRFAVLGGLLLAAPSIWAQSPSIDHQPVACVVAEKFPRLDARIHPGDSVATARILFQAELSPVWYAVSMKAEGPAFVGVLPKPKSSLKSFRYYIEVTDKAFGTARTPEYTSSVAARPGECPGKVAAALGSASVVLNVPAGAAALPAGFAATGVVAGSSTSAAATAGATAGGGGGLSTGAIAGIVGGAGAAAVGIAAVATKEAGTTTYSGPFSGTLVMNFPAPNGQGCVRNELNEGTLSMEIKVSGDGTVSGDAEVSATSRVVSLTAACVGGPQLNQVQSHGCCESAPPVRGTASSLSFGGSHPGLESSVWSYEFAGALSGREINGVFTLRITLPGGSGVANFPVTLR